MPTPGEGRGNAEADVGNALQTIVNAINGGLDAANLTAAFQVQLRLPGAYSDGLLSARPAAGVKGRIYRATDTSAVYIDNGTSWEELLPTGIPPLLTNVDMVALEPPLFSALSLFDATLAYSIKFGGP